MKNFSKVNHMNEKISSGIVGNVANFSGEPDYSELIGRSADLERRAFSAWFRSNGTSLQPNKGLSGFEMFDGLPYVVLRNCDGILAVYRVRMKNGQPGLNRLEEWPEGLDE